VTVTYITIASPDGGARTDSIGPGRNLIVIKCESDHMPRQDEPLKVFARPKFRCKIDLAAPLAA
jgi:hypothetical protein